MTRAAVVAVCVARAVAVDWAASPRTAIAKRPVAGPVRITPEGVAGDEQGDLVNHGGSAKAVYAYAREDAAWWGSALGRELLPGAFGENLAVDGLDVNALVIGERLRVGTAILEVTWPRIPCRSLAGVLGVPDMVRRFSRADRSGSYFSVEQPGEVAAGDPIEALDRPSHGVTVTEVFRARLGDRALVPRLLEAPQLSAEVHDWARKIMAG